MTKKRSGKGKRVVSGDGLSGVLDSPYGRMSVFATGGGVWTRKNGHRVKNGMLVGVTYEHRVPDHWIRMMGER